jgi:hypothetical protein
MVERSSSERPLHEMQSTSDQDSYTAAQTQNKEHTRVRPKDMLVWYRKTSNPRTVVAVVAHEQGTLVVVVKAPLQERVTRLVMIDTCKSISAFGEEEKRRSVLCEESRILAAGVGLETLLN